MVYENETPQIEKKNGSHTQHPTSTAGSWVGQVAVVAIRTDGESPYHHQFEMQTGGESSDGHHHWFVFSPSGR